jgi:hypothetical protein
VFARAKLGAKVAPEEALKFEMVLTVLADTEVAIEAIIKAAITIANFCFTYSSPLILRDKLFTGPYLSFSAIKFPRISRKSLK